jgi:predicted permease
VRADPQDALRGAGRGASTGADRHRVLRGAVVTQVALALTLALGAGLLVRSFARLTAADPGFRAEQVLTAQFALPRASYPDPGQAQAALARVLERVQAGPGVSAAALSTFLPFADGMDSSPFDVAGRPRPAGGAQPHAEYNLVSEDYFRAMGITLLRGRAFTGADDAGAQPVVIVDEQLAREYFAGEDPIGRRIRQLGDADAEIVGVVASVARAQLGERRKALVYYPLRQNTPGAVTVTVRGALPAAAAAALVRAAVADVDRQVPVFDVKPMRARVDESVGARRLATWAMGGFAGVALLLAALGLYGVLSYVVAQRRRELGIRSAMGAGAGELTRLVVGNAVRLAAAGAAAGLLLYAVSQRLLGALLYGVGAADPAALAAGVAAVGGAALLASWLPARRAAGVDPASALRAD